MEPHSEKINEIMDEEGQNILDAHQRVRAIVNKKEFLIPHLPVDYISLNITPRGGQ